MSDLKTILVTGKEELLGYSDQIRRLFEDCFSTSMSIDLWHWAYIDNPFGNPIVTMTVDDRQLVGHYAVVPYFLTNGKNEKIKSALSMTTMVAESHRKHYLFTKLAEETYSEMNRQEYDIVCGFPNLQSVSGFRKRLGWEIGEPDFVASVTKEQLINSQDLKSFLSDQKRFGFDCADKVNIDWRLEKPGFDYVIDNGNILKKFSAGYDLMSVEENSIVNLSDDRKYNVLFDKSVRDLLEFKDL